MVGEGMVSVKAIGSPLSYQVFIDSLESAVFICLWLLEPFAEALNGCMYAF